MKKIMFGNSLMLLGIAIMILAGLELIYIGIVWASFLLIPVGFIMAVIGREPISRSVRQNRFKSVAGLVGSLGTKQNDKSEVDKEF